MEFYWFLVLVVRYGYLLGFFAVFLDIMGRRAFLMPLAGSVRMPYGQFVLFDGLGAFFWSSLFIATGYLLGNQAEVSGEWLHRGLIFLGLLLVIAFVVYLAMKFSKLHRHGAGLFTRHSPGEPSLPECVQSAAEDPTKLACA